MQARNQERVDTYPGTAASNVLGNLLAITDLGGASAGLVLERGIAAVVDGLSGFELLDSHVPWVHAGWGAAGHGEQRGHEDGGGEAHVAF